MRKNYTSLLIGLFLLPFLFVPLVLEAQNSNNFIGFHLKSLRKHSFKYNFKQYNNLIVIPMEVNGIDTLNFVLDSGVGYTLITDPQVMEKLNLPCLRKIKVAGAGEEEELVGCISSVEKIQFKGIEANNHSLIILEEDILQLSRYAGIKIHGLIGYDILSRFVVEINFLNQTLIFTDPMYYKQKLGKKEELFTLSIEEMKPYVQAEAILKNSTSTPLKLILDTGAGHSLSLDTGTHPDIRVPDRFVTSQIGVTLNGAVKGAIARIEKFRLGSFEMEKVITAFPDSTSLRFMRGINQRQGNLGCGVLKRFHITFNYPHEKLILKPNRHFKTPFEFNTSGIELVASGSEYDEFEIGSVRKGSPAFEADLRRGDKIIAIDGEMIHNMDMNHIYKLINKKGGERTDLFMKRYNTFFIVSLLLQDPI